MWVRVDSITYVFLDEQELSRRGGSGPSHLHFHVAFRGCPGTLYMHEI